MCVYNEAKYMCVYNHVVAGAPDWGWGWGWGWGYMQQWVTFYRVPFAVRNNRYLKI